MTGVAKRVGWPLALLLSALVAYPVPSRAQPAQSEDEAQRLYIEGRQLLEAGDLTGALGKLEPSLAMRNSPNTELLMAHALRRLGKKPAAMVSYLRVVEHAGERVAKGESRYTATLDDAGRWVAHLRADLAEVQISVGAAPEGTKLAIDGAAAAPTRRGDDLLLTLWRDPGPVALRVDTPDGRTTAREQNAPAAQRTLLRIDLAPTPTPPGSPPPPQTAAPIPAPAAAADDGGPPAATWVAGAVALAGFGTFAVFGALSLDNAAEADGCSPNCSPSLTEEGQRNQTIANVAFAVGGAAAAVGVIAWIVEATSEGPPTNPRRGSRARIGRGLQFRF
jgi:hypothetical protein